MLISSTLPKKYRNAYFSESQCLLNLKRGLKKSSSQIFYQLPSKISNVRNATLVEFLINYAWLCLPFSYNFLVKEERKGANGLRHYSTMRLNVSILEEKFNHLYRQNRNLKEMLREQTTCLLASKRSRSSEA